jgi:hypothetical protein
MAEQTTAVTRPTTVSDIINQPLSHRCGRPFDRAYNSDRNHLFLNFIYDEYPECGLYPSSFGITCDIFHTFFGTIELHLVEADSSPSNPPAELPMESHTPTIPSQTPHLEASQSNANGGQRVSAVDIQSSPSGACEQAGLSRDVRRSESPSMDERAGSNFSHQSMSVESIIQGINAETDFAFYNIHDAKLDIVCGGDNAIRACEEYTRAYLRRGYTFVVVEDNGLNCMSLIQHLTHRHYRLRFVVQKGGSNSMSPAARMHIPQLIDKFHPGSDVQQIWECWWFQP